jgi:hypothetical protein
MLRIPEIREAADADTEASAALQSLMQAARLKV